MAEIGQIALAEAVRRTTEQQSTLATTRASAGTILSASTIGSAFLAGIALDGRSAIPCLAWLAFAATVATAVLTMLTLLPAHLGVVTDPEILDQPEWTSQSQNDAAMFLAKLIAKRAEANVRRLDHRWSLVMAAGMTTTASILFWILAIATR